MKKQRVFRRLNTYGIYALSLVIGFATVYSVAAII
jgi:hypothetical protein